MNSLVESAWPLVGPHEVVAVFDGADHVLERVGARSDGGVAHAHERFVVERVGPRVAGGLDAHLARRFLVVQERLEDAVLDDGDVAALHAFVVDVDGDAAVAVGAALGVVDER